MNVISFVLKNWQDIVVILVLIASAIMAVQKWIRVKGPLFNAMSTKERVAYVTRLLLNLIPSTLILVTDAEIQFGGSTGTLKRSYVIDELYKRIPDEYKKYVTEENLDALINKVLPEAQKLWSDNPNVNMIVTGQCS